MVVLSSEIGTAIDISSVKWHRHAATSTDAEDENFSMYMGLCSSDQLSTDSFEGNYISGTRTLVYSTNLHTVDMNEEWAEITLDNSYWYNGTDNLIIEIQWENDTHSNSYYNHQWYGGDNRCIYVEDFSDILSFPYLPHMFLCGEWSLDNTTFGSIKVEIGR